MKMHIGVDDSFGLIYSIATTSANEHDIIQVSILLHGDEQREWDDAGYAGIDKRPEHQEYDVEWFIAMRPGKRAALLKKRDLAKAEKSKPAYALRFQYIKRVFGYSKVRYRGLVKNTNRLHVLAALANLLRTRPYLTRYGVSPPAICKNADCG